MKTRQAASAIGRMLWWLKPAPMLRNPALTAPLVLSVVVAGIDLGARHAQSKAVGDGVYTDAQAERGKATYEAQCAACHLSDLSGQAFAPPLVEDTFKIRWQDGSVGDLFTVVKQTMPQDKPASLSDKEYAGVVAYLLKSNRYPTGKEELPSEIALLNEVTFKQK
jgi:mono/diheme cytochrome c family protein